MTSSFFFFNHTATTEIYTLSLHDALPISDRRRRGAQRGERRTDRRGGCRVAAPIRHPAPRHPPRRDRKRTRLNSSHTVISYAVFCLKKKKQRIDPSN